MTAVFAALLVILIGPLPIYVDAYLAAGMTCVALSGPRASTTSWWSWELSGLGIIFTWPLILLLVAIE